MKIVTPYLRCAATLLLTIILVGALSSPTLAIQFRDFFGTHVFAHNQLSYSEPLWSTALSTARRDLFWSGVEPTAPVNGTPTFDDAYLQSYIAGLIAPAQAAGVSFIPVLDYSTAWSYDQTERTYYDTADGLENSPYGHATTKYTMAPLGNNQFQYTVYTWRTFSQTWRQSSQTTMSGVNSEENSSFPSGWIRDRGITSGNC